VVRVCSRLDTHSAEVAVLVEGQCCCAVVLLAGLSAEVQEPEMMSQILQHFADQAALADCLSVVLLCLVDMARVVASALLLLALAVSAFSQV
jgi:hypothetical protein